MKYCLKNFLFQLLPPGYTLLFYFFLFKCFVHWLPKWSLWRNLLVLWQISSIKTIVIQKRFRVKKICKIWHLTIFLIDLESESWHTFQKVWFSFSFPVQFFCWQYHMSCLRQCTRSRIFAKDPFLVFHSSSCFLCSAFLN